MGRVKQELEVLHIVQGCGDHHIFRNAMLEEHHNGTPAFVMQAGLKKWAADQMRFEAATQIYTALYAAMRLEPHGNQESLAVRRNVMVAFPKSNNEKGLIDDKELRRLIAKIWPYSFEKKKKDAPAFKVRTLPREEAERSTGMRAGCITPFGLTDDHLAPDVRLVHEETATSIQALLFVRPQSNHDPSVGILLQQGKYLVIGTKKYDGLLNILRNFSLPGVHVVDREEESPSLPMLAELSLDRIKPTAFEGGEHIVNR